MDCIGDGVREAFGVSVRRLGGWDCDVEWMGGFRVFELKAFSLRMPSLGYYIVQTPISGYSLLFMSEIVAV